MEGDGILPPLRTDPAGSSDSDSGDADDPSYARGTAAGQGPRSQEGEALAAVDLRGFRLAGPVTVEPVGQCGCREVGCAQQRGRSCLSRWGR